MNAFDKHIRDKMTKMEINPSREVSELIKSNKPKPGIKHLLNQYGHWFATGIALIGVLSFVIFTNPFAEKDMSNNNTVPQSREQQYDGNTQITSSGDGNKATEEENPKAVKTGDADKKDLRQTKHKEIYSYNSNVVLISDKKGNWLSKSEAEIITTKHNECVVHCPDYGKYSMLWFNDSGDSIYYQIDYQEKPHIFTSKDTSVNGLNCEISCKTNYGTWQVPDGIELTTLNKNTIYVSAQSHGRYVVIRTENDSIDRYSDTIAVHFLATDNIFRVISRPDCPGESAVIIVDNGYVPRSDQMTCKKTAENEYKLSFNPSASESATCSIVDEKSGNKIDTINFSVPEKVELNYETHPQTCKSNGSVYLMENSDVTGIYLDGEKVDTEKHISLDTGNYTLMWEDINGCMYNTEITISREGILKAGFELEISLDGFSARTKNTTNYSDKTRFDNLYYEWYVNGKLQSTAMEPELQLDELSNKVKLYVTDGHQCSDSMIKSDIEPDHSLIRVPNFFTPNNDGYFDEFKILIDPRLSGFNAIITSRSGQKVYKWTDPSEGWDGKIFGNENASEGVYFYIIQAYDSTGRAIEKRGTLQLIR